MVVFNKNLTIAAVLIIASVFAVFYFIYPAYKNNFVLKEEIMVLEENLSRQKTLKTKINSVYDDYSSQDPKKIDFIQNRIAPSSFDIPQLLIQMEALTTENGLIMKSISFVSAGSLADKKTTQSEIKSGSMTIALEGSYYAFKNFLKNVESNVRLMDVSSISFSAPILSQKQLIPIFSFNVSLQTYYK